MMSAAHENFVRTRITQLRMERNVSEHRMSLELGKSGSYIRSITSGAILPSLRELFNIIAYLDTTPVKFFEPMEDMENWLLNALIRRCIAGFEEEHGKITLPEDAEDAHNS